MSNKPIALANMSRGVAAFDAQHLSDAIAAMGAFEQVPFDTLTEYRAFYGLDHLTTPHQHTMFPFDTQGERIVVQYFLPDAPQGYVMMVHGYYDHVGLFAHVIDFLLSHNLAVVAFDQIGHGLSSGARATINSFDQYVAVTAAVYAHAKEVFGPAAKWHWFAQSMGGAVVMEYLQQKPPETVGEIVLLAPLVRPYAWGINRWVFAIAKLTITERPRTLTENAENPEFHALQAVDPLQPRILPVAWVQAMVNWFKRFEAYPTSELAPLILQGDADHTVAWQYNLKVFARRYPNCQRLVIPTGRHHLANESPAVRQQMWGFLDAHCRW